MADTVGELFIFAQKMGPNLSEMEFRTFLSIGRAIWDQWLAQFYGSNYAEESSFKVVRDVEKLNKLSAFRTIVLLFFVSYSFVPRRDPFPV